jgi:hypothetical protein
MKDSRQTVSIALPNAGATVVTPVLDLGFPAIGPVCRDFRLRLSNTTATGVATKTITAKIQSCDADGGNAVDVPGLGSVAIVAAGSAYPAKELEVFLPPATNKRYFKATATGESGGGNASDGTLKLEVVI